MKTQQRNIVTCVLLSLVTCGIYGIYWLVCLAKDVTTVKDKDRNTTTNIVLFILLPFLGFFLAERQFTEDLKAMGIAHEDRSILYLILGLLGLGIVDACLMQNDMNNVLASNGTNGTNGANA